MALFLFLYGHAPNFFLCRGQGTKHRAHTMRIRCENRYESGIITYFPKNLFAFDFSTATDDLELEKLVIGNDTRSSFAANEYW
jgi:hypothetical protein